MSNLLLFAALGFLVLFIIQWMDSGPSKVVIFFLACVLAAGIFGALTASRKILYIQALPALLALVAVLTQA